MTPRILLAIAFLASSALSGQVPASAEKGSSGDPVLERLVEEAFRNNPEIAGANAAVEAARLQIEPARALPDPSLSVNYQNDGKSPSLGSRDMTFLSVMYSQPLPFPGKRGLAAEEATSRAAGVAEGTLGRVRLSVRARVERAYFEYLLAREELELTEDRFGSWRQISDIVRQRYAVGLGVQQDVLRAQAEVLRLDEARADQNARLASRRAEINRAVGRPQDTAVETSARLSFPREMPPLSVTLEELRGRSPELAGIARSIEAARLRVSQAKKNFLPDFVASGGPMYRGRLEPMWQVGLGVTLPIFGSSRQRPLYAAAQADVRSEEARAEATRQELEWRTRERFESLTAALKVARLYQENVLPVDQLSLESAIARYRSGKVPFVTVLESLNTLYADRSLALTRLAEAQKWRVAIDEAAMQAVGGMTAATQGTTPASASSAMSPSPSMR